MELKCRLFSPTPQKKNKFKRGSMAMWAAQGSSGFISGFAGQCNNLQ